MDRDRNYRAGMEWIVGRREGESSGRPMTGGEARGFKQVQRQEAGMPRVRIQQQRGRGTMAVGVSVVNSELLGDVGRLRVKKLG